MSTDDRDKWQTRYLHGAYAERTNPAVFLQQKMPSILASFGVGKGLHALDLACGAGRNSLYLACQGFAVDAVDIAEAALTRARTSADAQGIDGIQWIEHDLDKGLPTEAVSYDLIIMIRYLDIDLLKNAANAASYLTPGGYLLAEVHLQSDQPVAGPTSSNFRAVPGALRTAAEGLELLDYEEGIFTDPDDNQVALARLLARRAG